MASPQRKLLVLDLDETLIFATEEPLTRPADFLAFGYHVYRRPFLTQFVSTMAEHFALAVWSSASDDYVQVVVENIWLKDISLEFVWGRSRASMRRVISDRFYDADPSNHLSYRKPLVKLEKLGRPLQSILILDDTPSKSAQNYGNAIYPKEWEGDEEDDDLLLLARYLPTLVAAENVRSIEKRDWRSKALALG